YIHLSPTHYTYTLSLHDALPISAETLAEFWELTLINQFHDILPGTSIGEVYVDSDADYEKIFSVLASANGPWQSAARAATGVGRDRKSTRLNSSHVKISYAVFCL